MSRLVWTSKYFMHNQIRLSITESAKMFGVSEKTIRRAVKNEELKYIIVAGRYKISFESLVRWSQKKTLINNKTNIYGIGQFVEKWKIKNKLYSPREPEGSEQGKENK